MNTARTATGRAASAPVRVTAAAALAASAVGSLTEGGYRADAATEWTLRGFDLVTLLVVVPALTFLPRRGGRLAHVRTGLLLYLLYGSLFAAATGGLGSAFLLQVAVACAATLTLVHIVVTRGPAPVAVGRVGRRMSASLLALLAASLAGMWVTASLRAARDGTVPAGSSLVESELAVRLGMVLDLWLLVPLYALAAVLLWRGRKWGRALGLVAGVSGLVHQLSYLAALLAQARADVPGARAFDPLEPAIVAVYALILLPLVRTPAQAQLAGSPRSSAPPGRDEPVTHH